MSVGSRIYLVMCFSNSGLSESLQREGVPLNLVFEKLPSFMNLKTGIVFLLSLSSVKCYAHMILPCY